MNGSTEKQMDNSPDADDVQMGVFFLPGPIWGSTVLRIYIRNMVHIHRVKLHLPHMYMIFVEC